MEDIVQDFFTIIGTIVFIVLIIGLIKHLKHGKNI